jgi:hypothetical protein
MVERIVDCNYGTLQDSHVYKKVFSLHEGHHVIHNWESERSCNS